jgi:aliphatic sulfonates family ABC transporter substrate-binding protein
MMSKSMLPVVPVIIFVLSLGCVFANSPASAQTPLPITIGYQANTDWLLLVARNLNLFEKAGLAPTFVKFVAGPPMIAAAQGKNIDVASIGSVPFLLGLAQGVDWVIIGINPEQAYGEGLVARNGSGIATVADLAGKRIGFLKGSTAHFGLITALQQLGIRRDQVELLDMPPAEQLTALANKKIDAAMVWEPWMQRMVHEANARIIITEGEMGTYMSIAVYGARRDWLRDNRETGVRFLRAILMANDVIQKSPGIGVKALAVEMGIREGWVEAIYENVPPPKIDLWTDPHYRYSLVKGSAFHRRLGYLSSFLFEEKLISQKVDVRDILDASVISEALKTWKTGQ